MRGSLRMAEQEEKTEAQLSSSTEKETQKPQTEERREGEVGGQGAEREAPIAQIRELKVRIEALEKELAQEREKATDYMNRAMRAQAEVINTRKRLQQDISLMLKDALR